MAKKLFKKQATGEFAFVGDMSQAERYMAKVGFTVNHQQDHDNGFTTLYGDDYPLPGEVDYYGDYWGTGASREEALRYLVAAYVEPTGEFARENVKAFIELSKGD